jgi:hypothetical protein
MDRSGDSMIVKCVASTPQCYNAVASKAAGEASVNPKPGHEYVSADGGEERVVVSNYFKSADWYGNNRRQT